MKPRTVIVLAALLAIALWANALNQVSAPAPKSGAAAACACCKTDAKKSCCTDGKCDAKSCCKDAAACKEHCAKMAKDGQGSKDAKGCCGGKDGASCPMMAKNGTEKGCCGGASCPMHGHAAGK